MDFSEYNPKEKIQKLFENQKQLLDTFLENGAISKEQYNKSLNTLIKKMNICNSPDIK